MIGNNPQTKGGFTLMEIIVSIALFSIVSVSITSSFVVIMRSQKKILGMQSVQDSARMLLEIMSREIRMARIDGDGSCTGIPGRTFDVLNSGMASGAILNFKNSREECVTYAFAPVNEKVTKTVQSTDASGNITSSTYDIIDPDIVRITKLKFYFRDNRNGGAGLKEYPFVTIFTELKSLNSNDEERKIKMQTSVSARAY